MWDAINVSVVFGNFIEKNKRKGEGTGGHLEIVFSGFTSSFFTSSGFTSSVV